MDLQSIQDFLASNQFASGGLLLGAAGGAVAALRSYPDRIFRWARSKCITTVEVLDRDEAYLWIDRWLSMHEYSEKSRRLSLWTYHEKGSGVPFSDTPDVDGPRIMFSPSPGIHWIRHEGVWMAISKVRKEVSSGGVQAYLESIEIKAFSRSRTAIEHLVKQAKAISVPTGGLQIFAPYYEEWKVSKRTARRVSGSVILQEGVAESLLTDVQRFLSSRDWYTRVGIPYRRGYLFYGPPGSGKTSSVSAIASELGLNICVLSLANPSLTDDKLSGLMENIPSSSILLLEDIDCAGNAARKDSRDKDQKGVTLSGLLNSLDGVGSADGQIVIMTTNCVEKIDAAVIRPGRVDYRIEMKNATKKQAASLFARFYPESLESSQDRFAESAGDGVLSMACLQGVLIKNRDSEEDAIVMAESERLARESAGG